MKALFLSILAGLLAASSGFGQTVIHGTIGVAAGGALVDGDQPAFQERFRQRKDGYGGLEDFSLTRTTNDSLFRLTARAIPGNEDYQVSARWERFDAFYVQANYQQFRTFYDGAGGFFPAGTSRSILSFAPTAAFRLSSASVFSYSTSARRA